MLLLLFSVAFAEAQGAEKARIKESFVVNSHTELLLYFTLDGAISSEMEKGILNGIPVTFAFFVELYEHVEGKGPVQLVTRNLQHTLYFETLKEVFTLEQTEQSGKSTLYKNLDEATLALLRVHDLPVTDLALLKPGLTYSIKIKAELAKQGMPEKFKNVMTFLKIWYFETEWKEVLFTMAAGTSSEQ
ncbi:MAG: DUF4390 domain-containing protein [Thermodesulfobacteriota bacterium]